MPGDAQEQEVSRQVTGQSLDSEDRYLRDLFEKEIASEHDRRRNRITIS